MTNYLRPDEQAAFSEIERSESRNKNMRSGLKTASSIGAAAGGASIFAGGKLASKILPFLNEYIPSELAMKGISKVSPSLGEFLKKGLSKGLNLKDGLNFVKENLGAAEPPKENRNVIEQYSPELHQFILEQIQQGRSPLEAGALAQLESKGAKGFRSIIDKITKDHKAPWSAILKTAYADQQTSPQSSTSETMNTGTPGSGQQALMAILQKLQQVRGA